MAKKEKIITVRNRLLGAFESASRERVDPYIERIEVTLGDIVCEAGSILNHAYFPDGAVLSLLTVLENGTAIETANIGREGASGLFAAMYSRSSFNRSLVQLEGGLLRVPIKVLQSEFERSAHIRNLFVSYSETLAASLNLAEEVHANSLVDFRFRCEEAIDVGRRHAQLAGDIGNRRLLKPDLPKQTLRCLDNQFMSVFFLGVSFTPHVLTMLTIISVTMVLAQALRLPRNRTLVSLQ